MPNRTIWRAQGTFSRFVPARAASWFGLGRPRGLWILAHLAGLKPAAVICEIMNEDGSMARVPELLKFCKKHDLKILSIAKLIEYRLQRESQVKRFVEVDLPTDYGQFKLIGYETATSPEPHLALCKGGIGDLDETGTADRASRSGPGPRAFGVPHGRFVPFPAVRVRLSAHHGDGDDRERGHWSVDLPSPGRAGDRPVEQAAGLQAPGAGVSTRSTPIWSWVLRPTGAITGSGPRFVAIWGFGRSES